MKFNSGEFERNYQRIESHVETLGRWTVLWKHIGSSRFVKSGDYVYLVHHLCLYVYLLLMFIAYVVMYLLWEYW
jgi:hypothetical protein